MAEPARAKPKPTPETQHFWDGTQAGELRLQRCDACANVYFPPRPFCPSCASRKVSIFKASGKGTLYSYVLVPLANRRPAGHCHPDLRCESAADGMGLGRSRGRSWPRRRAGRPSAQTGDGHRGAAVG